MCLRSLLGLAYLIVRIVASIFAQARNCHLKYADNITILSKDPMQVQVVPNHLADNVCLDKFCIFERKLLHGRRDLSANLIPVRPKRHFSVVRLFISDEIYSLIR